MQHLPQELNSGNVYEAGQLNLLSVLELTNHALQLLKEEKARVSHCPQAFLVPEQLQDKCQQMSRVLQDLHLIRQKISKEELPEVKGAIRELEQEWDRKWSDVLQTTPLTTFLNEDPALGFLSPMAPLSFKPAPEASYKSSIFTQYPAKLHSSLAEKPLEKQTKEPVTKSNVCLDFETNVPVVSAEASSRANTSLDWLFDGASPVNTEPVPVPKVIVKSSAPLTLSKVTPLRSRTEIIELECDNLADQFADAIATSSATPGHAKGLDLEDLLNTIQGDPFSTRKQLPRTPESLIMDVKSSWRKAVEEDKAERLRSTKLSDSIMGLLTPVGEASYSFQSPFAPAPTKPKVMPPVVEDTPSVSQQGALMKSNLGWETFTSEMMDSPSGTGSSAVQFSLDHETLPEMPSCDSLLSLDDVDVKSEEEVSPHLQTELKRETLQQECTENLFGQINTAEQQLGLGNKPSKVR
ncbi:hypothetical protein NL108_005431 [Boleophthalmus pectinirostris]|nr:hypothetical protein NL108_005431 [Boleophthalmus pectinirostris]